MRYLLFGGDKFYPLGGWQDFKARFEDLEMALGVAAWSTYKSAIGRYPGRDWEWWQIVDLETGKIVKEGVTEANIRNPDQEE